MKIGILTYHRAINFGANLQLYSTYNYLENQGYVPIIINYLPQDLEALYSSFPQSQITEHIKFIKPLFKTEECRNAKEVAEQIDNYDINNIIIGSDAVAQHHPLFSRISFPTKRIFHVDRISSDRMFPNPFWGTFIDYLRRDINIVAMSTSSQQSSYKLFDRKMINRMMYYLNQFSYISARDNWTKDMYKYISDGNLNVNETPDPVFAFNYNVSKIPTEQEIRTNFNLPNKYILVAIRQGRSINSNWVYAFQNICNRNGYDCIGLPFPYGFTKVNILKNKIQLPLSPIDWYALIKYADGFVGHNMHTIVSALHNSVPCYSFDQYGIRILGQFVNEKSSKIYHILSKAGFSDYRVSSGLIIDKTPSPQIVFDKLQNFDRNMCRYFASYYYQEYVKMMRDIEQTFI